MDIPTLPTEQEQVAAEIAEYVELRESERSWTRTAVGAGILATGAAFAWALASHSLDEAKFAQEMPFNETAQSIVNSVDDTLVYAGEAALTAALLEIGVVKVGARFSSRWRSIDKRSSQELSDEGHGRPSFGRRVLQAGAAGSIPVVVAASAGLGGLTAAIGAEITDGPSRPIEAFGTFAPGKSMITQFETAMPMLESTLSEKLTSSVEKQAHKQGVAVTSLALGLNSIKAPSGDFTGLTLGVEADRLPPVMRFAENCEQIPVIIDKSSNIAVGTKLEINGVPGTVVAQTEQTSAINRIGVVMDKEALATCINKSAENQSHAIILDTDQKTAQDILKKANVSHETSVVIGKDRYIQNSEDFWRNNVKPITNTLALASLGTAFIAMAGTMGSRMLRNRRELAAKLAAGEPVNHFRITEQLRAAKDGVLGSAIGVVAVGAIAPLVNALESGMRVGIGFREAMVGFAVGIIGSTAGALSRIVRPGKLVNPSEHTRV